MKPQKVLEQILGGSKNVRFQNLIKLAEAYGFELSRVSGSHHIFVHPEIDELLNLQNVKGKAKPYQMRQLLNLVEQHNLQMQVDL